jgi:hypothetical protein
MEYRKCGRIAVEQYIIENIPNYRIRTPLQKIADPVKKFLLLPVVPFSYTGTSWSFSTAIVKSVGGNK